MMIRNLEMFLKILETLDLPTSTTAAISLTVIEMCSLGAIILEGFSGVKSTFEQANAVRKIITISYHTEKLTTELLMYYNQPNESSSWESRDIQPNENNRFLNRNRQENWRETRGNNRYADNSRSRREFYRFESQCVVDNQRFDGRRRGGQSDHRFHNQGDRQGGSRNSNFRGQNYRNRYLNF
ncbi:hypothetical protein TNCV_377171 [Trichonephila clavipes]|nr:hypothetical protein TNCV_377171 [Trichonephila clavipes]